MSGLRVCRPSGARSLFLLDPGAARWALAPGYLLAAPSALDARDAFCRATAVAGTLNPRGWALSRLCPMGQRPNQGHSPLSFSKSTAGLSPASHPAGIAVLISTDGLWRIRVSGFYRDQYYITRLTIYGDCYLQIARCDGFGKS